MSCGECDLELAGSKNRILVEKLVKIAQPEKKERSGIELLYLEILPEHRRRVFHIRSGLEVRFRV